MKRNSKNIPLVSQNLRPYLNLVGSCNLEKIILFIPPLTPPPTNPPREIRSLRKGYLCLPRSKNQIWMKVSKKFNMFILGLVKIPYLRCKLDNRYGIMKRAVVGLGFPVHELSIYLWNALYV